MPRNFPSSNRSITWPAAAPRIISLYDSGSKLTAVAEKVGTLRTANEFLRERAGTAKPKHLLKYLRRAPKVAPVEGDEMRLQWCVSIDCRP